MGLGKARTSRTEASNSGKDSVPLSTYRTPLNHNYRVCIPDYYKVLHLCNEVLTTLARLDLRITWPLSSTLSLRQSYAAYVVLYAGLPYYAYKAYFYANPESTQLL